MDLVTQRGRIAGYWLSISCGIGAFVTLLGFTPPLPVWLTISGTITLLGLNLLASVRLGQVNRRVWREQPTASVGFASWLVVPFSLAMLVRATPAALWAVPLLALGTSVLAYEYLRRRGPFLLPDGSVLKGLP
jgi:hypothetical protein